MLPALHGFLLSRVLPLACVGKLDLPAVSRGPSPLPEPAPAGDIVSGELSCFIFTASLFSLPFFLGRVQQASTYRDIFLHGAGVRIHMHTSPVLPKGARFKDVDTQLRCLRSSPAASLHVCEPFRAGRKAVHEKCVRPLDMKLLLIDAVI